MKDNFFDFNTFEDIYEELRMVYLNDKRPWIIGYSGGKDSSAVVQLVFQMLLDLPTEQRHKQVHIVSSNTLVENPMILDYLEKNSKIINDKAKELNIPISTHIVQPEYDNTYWTNIIGKGWPTPKSLQFRWCTERLKIKPSDKFIYEQISENGQVVILLGVRKSESSARNRRITKREIEGYLLTPHENITNAYVYNPVVDLTTDDVWHVLLNRERGLSPWGSDNNTLFKLYQGSDSGECPFTISSKNGEVTTPSCGNSRFGCWVCPVVKEDKSLNGFIKNGEHWLIPLARFRQWLISIRDEEQYRNKIKRNGTIFIKKDGNVGFGPFTFEARQLILQKLLETQNEMHKVRPDYDLITLGELKAIDKIWDNEEDLTRRILVDLYYNVTNRRLPWDDYKKPLFETDVIETIKVYCESHNVPVKLMTNLIIETDKYKHFSNNAYLKKSINSIMNKQWLHMNLDGAFNEVATEEIANDH